jgi:hypothetical protein
MAKDTFNNSGGGSASKITPTNYVVGGIPASGEIDLARKTNEEFPRYWRETNRVYEKDKE